MNKKFVIWLENFLRKKNFDEIKRIGDRLGKVMWMCLPKRRKLAITSIKKHLLLDESKAKKIAYQSFCQNARSFLEISQIPKIDENFLTERLIVDQPELWEEMLTQESGAIATTAHLGAWELLAGLLGIYFPSKPSKVIIVRKNKNKVLNERIFRLREAKGATVISHRNISSNVLKILKEGGMAAFLVDHNCNRHEALFLPFLNEMAAVNMGPALLAVRARVPVFSIFLIREQEKYRLFVEPWLEPQMLKGSISARVKFVAENYTDIVAKYVQRFPEQWFWMHNRWKTKVEN